MRLNEHSKVLPMVTQVLDCDLMDLMFDGQFSLWYLANNRKVIRKGNRSVVE